MPYGKGRPRGVSVPTVREIQSWGKPSRRSNAAIQRDIDAVSESLAKLNAELAATQPGELTIHSFHHTIRQPATFRARRSGISIASDMPLCNSYDLGATHALRDWLNYHYPQEAS